jgi:hypothetical protein
VKRISSFLVVAVAIAGVIGLGATRSGGERLPFGIELPGVAGQPAQAAEEVTLGAVEVDGAGTDTTVTVGNGGSVRLSASYGVQFIGTAPTTPTVSLERRTGSGAWTATDAHVTAAKGQPMTVDTPAYAASGRTASVQYRFRSGASTTRPLTVVYENQQRYTGLAARLYGYLAASCPGTAVHVEDLHGREAGEYTTGALLIRVDPAVGRTTVLAAIDQRALALHECSHERQWVNYGSTEAGRTAMSAAAARYFSVPGNTIAPIEHAADCGAQALNPGGYLAYGGTCTATQLREGRKLLHGARY